MKVLIVLGLILVLATGLRIYNLDQVPIALSGDELDVGYQAYSILTTGRDYTGHLLPFYIKSLTEYRPPAYIYFDVPFVAIVGLNELGVRFPSAFFGVLSILGFFLLVRLIFKNKLLALIASFWLAISPWHIQFSRIAFDVTILLSAIIFGSYFFIRAVVDTKKGVIFVNLNLVLAAVCFGLSFYIYRTATVFIPLWVLLLSIIYRRELFSSSLSLNCQRLIIPVVVGILMTMPMIWAVESGLAKARFDEITIFQDSVLIDKAKLAARGTDYFTSDHQHIESSARWESLLHNRRLIFGQVLAANYLEAFSPNFLFSQGDPNLRQSVTEMGQMYLIDLLLIGAGLIFLLSRYQRKIKWLVFGWLLISPIPAVLTIGGGHHATRLILELPPLIILSSLGIFGLLQSQQLMTKKILIGACLVVAVVQFGLYLHRYYVHYAIESWRFWQIGYKEVMTYIHTQEPNYKLVLLNDSYEPSLIRYLFYTKFSPADFQAQFRDQKVVTNLVPGFDGYKFTDKLFIGSLNLAGKQQIGFERFMKPGMLYLASARDEVPGPIEEYGNNNFEVKKIIYNPIGEAIFYILGGK